MTLDNVEEKIKKLLRLAADNPSPNEAAAAFARASALATRHMLDLDSIDTTDPDEEPAPRREVVQPIRQCVETWRQRVGWKMTIARAVGRAIMCKVAWSKYGLYMYGQPDDLLRAEMLYNQISHQVEGIARQAVKDYHEEMVAAYGSVRNAVECGEPTPRTYGRNFRLGMADEISRRTRSAQQEAEAVRKELEAGDAPQSTALVRVDNALAYVEEVTTAVATFYKEKVKGKSVNTRGPNNAGGYAQGRVAGRDVNLDGATAALGDGN